MMNKHANGDWNNMTIGNGAARTKKIVSVPPTYFFLCAALSVASYFLVPDLNAIRFPYGLAAGLPLFIVGTYLVLRPHFLLERFGTPENYRPSTCVVKNDVYAYSRNPMYAGFLLILIGLSCALGNVLSFTSPLIFFAIMHRMFIPYEEKKMKKECGDEYHSYRRSVRRWI